MAGGSNPPSATNLSGLADLAAAVDGGARALGVADDAHLVLAVSGGSDSMALLYGAAHLVATGARSWAFSVAHLDHGLRPDSPDDASFVADAAASLHLPCHVGRADVAALARSEGRSTEDAGRQARYRFLEDVAPPDALLVTAHTADDAAETVLLNLMRGAGLSGVRGIPMRRGRIVRPLLRTRRATLRGLLDQAGIPFRDDPSNEDPAYLRNRVRREVLPLIEALRPGAVDRIGHFAQLAADDDSLLTELAQAELTRRQVPDGGISWRDAPPPALGRRVLRLAVGHPAPSAERVEAVLQAASGDRGGVTIELGDDRVVEVRQRVVRIVRGPSPAD